MPSLHFGSAGLAGLVRSNDGVGDAAGQINSRAKWEEVGRFEQDNVAIPMETNSHVPAAEHREHGSGTPFYSILDGAWDERLPKRSN